MKTKTVRCVYCSKEILINHKGHLTSHVVNNIKCHGTGFDSRQMEKLNQNMNKSFSDKEKSVDLSESS